MSNEFFELHDIDEDTLHDFNVHLHESINDIEHDLFKLERDPHNQDAIHSIFRALHMIKGNCLICYMTPFAEYTHAMEDLFSQLRCQQITFTPHIKEAVLLSLDKFRSDADALELEGEIIITPLKKIASAFKKLTQAPITEVEIIAAEIIKQIGGEAAHHLPLSETPGKGTTAHHIIHEFDTDEDLDYFKKIASSIDDNSPFWENKSEETVHNCLGINQLLTTPIDSRQLMTAAYLHDTGMAFIPYEIVHKTQVLNTFEEKKIQCHVMHSYEWLKRLPGWQEASQMVLQHHERPDGNGYPNNTKGEDICTGAKILAVADTFFAVTHQRADRSYKRSLLRAITEINNCAGTQFDTEVVTAFNKMIRRLHSKK
ncbi:MAG: HD domain-containing protein [Pseudomonadales bacterium]|nr:HD domain-containing protein [Pseudomonadales bacterium]